MTSDGHAITRLHRLVTSDRGTVHQIRALVAELPARPDLELALMICLALLEREPETWPRAAARWGSRLTLERKLTLADAQLALAALAVLPGPGARGGVEALIDLADRHGLPRVAEQLAGWADRRGLGA